MVRPDRDSGSRRHRRASPGAPSRHRRSWDHGIARCQRPSSAAGRLARRRRRPPPARSRTRPARPPAAPDRTSGPAGPRRDPARLGPLASGRRAPRRRPLRRHGGLRPADRFARRPESRYRAAYARALGFAGPALPATLAALGACFAEAGLWSVPAPGARVVVGCLAAWGVPVVVVSNTEHGEAATLLARAGIWSHPVPVRPRDARVPGSAAQGGPEALLHVGDSSAADVAGATAAGIAALHLDPLDRCPDRRHPHLASLLELLGRFHPAGGSEPG